MLSVLHTYEVLFNVKKDNMLIGSLFFYHAIQ